MRVSDTGTATPPDRQTNQEFLLKVADALRFVGDPLEVQAIATRMLSEFFDASRVAYVEMDEGKEILIHRDAVRHGAASIQGRYPWRVFVNASIERAWRSGEVWAIDNVETDPSLVEERANYVGMKALAMLAHVIQKDGKFVGALGMHSAWPRMWSDADKSLLRELTERTWVEVERARAATDLRESEEKYRSLFTSIGEGFCILELLFDAGGAASDVRYLEANPAFERHTGLASPAGRTHTEHVGTAPEASELELYAEALRSGAPQRQEVFWDAVGRWLETSVVRLGNAEERRLACVFKDTTERKQAEVMMQLALEREQAARAVAEEATALRDDFISVVSHELRTPLSALVIWSRALQSGAVSPERSKEALEAIVSSANLQHALVDELLDMSRLKAGKIQIAVQEQDLRVVVEEASSVLRPTALTRGVELSVDVGSDALSGLVDRGRLHQVLWNVIGNAIKFTPAGGHVAVLLRASATSAVVEVKDDGAGISPAFLPHLFDRFRQADMSQTRSFGGLGLGLSIARQLVEMHGGAITAASEGKGRGATFRIELPRAAPGVMSHETLGGASKFVPRAALAGLRVLVVEDEAHTRAVLVWLMETCGAEVVAAASGAAAREAAALGARFDVLVCDLGLPNDDGCALLPALRKFPDYRLPAMALTAYVRQQDRERALAAGFDAFLCKPVAPDIFIDAVGMLGRLAAAE